MNRILRLALALALLFPAATAALAGDFAADMLLTADGKFLQDGRVYVKGSRMRLETAVEDELQVFIIDAALGKACMLQTAAKSYLELPLDPRRLGLLALSGRPDAAKWRRIGREPIENWDCEKRALELKNPGGASGEMTIWYAEQLGMPIKSVLREGGRSITMEYRNIRPGSIAPALFTVPAGYQRMTMPAPPQGMGAPAPDARPAIPAGKGAPHAQE
ncbi:DUF4412 domain-containing protein [Fundidesulfovibrio agrisoli]|uniref:DUF4412 domain-containing protein n=1 Tax=Fundidesulfovibrio agrisoli TaxID=2922717 RepID=UPI001FAC4952|nr:DUF4412 domain-containing protein [Fundidesulfovibrio agrisoli]